MVAFKPLSPAEREDLSSALKANAESGGAVPLHMNPKDTSFRPVNRIAALLGTQSTPPADAEADREVINQIKSVPCHY